MTMPQTLNRGAVEKVFAIIAARGITTTEPPPADDPVTDTIQAGLRAAEARIPARYRDAQAAHPQVAAWVERMVAAARKGPGGAPGIGQGSSLLIVGPTGTGKTHQAFGAVRSLLGAGVRLRWHAATAADLYAALRPRPGADSERELMAIARCPLLILDDLGAAKGSEWTEEITYRLVDHRYAHMLPTLITSNLPIAQLRHALGDRVSSRLAEMTDRVMLTGPDRRRPRRG
ncbi:ATP-binding protein [Streptomyces carpaticus]|uniref:ATP-binding protein n=1 Tax=Streptomyces carpaticus TaxID=285558 RepID=UPI0021FB1503|nr:ATP-binding protein [Streptomyces carpaticus]